MRVLLFIFTALALVRPSLADQVQYPGGRSFQGIEVEERSVPVCQGGRAELPADEGWDVYTWYKQTENLSLRLDVDGLGEPSRPAMELEPQEEIHKQILEGVQKSGRYYVLMRKGEREKLMIFDVETKEEPEIVILPEPPFEDDIDKDQEILKVPFEEEVVLKMALRDPDKFKDRNFTEYTWMREGVDLERNFESLTIFPVFGATYKLVAKDEFGCRPEATLEVQVRRLRVHFMMGEEFSTFNTGSELEGQDGDEDDDDEPDRAFSNDRFFVGFSGESYAFFGPYASLVPFLEVRLGAANIQTDSDQSNSDFVTVLRDTPVVDSMFGVKWEFLPLPRPKRGMGEEGQEQGADEEDEQENARFEEYVQKHRHSTLYAKAAYGAIVPESNEAREDLLDQSFFGVGFAYTRVGHRFFRNYLEIGLGRSDNLKANSTRFKFNGAAYLDIVSGWQFLLSGTADLDRGPGPDDLRIMIGLQRDIRYITNLLKTTLLGNGDDEDDEEE